MADAQPLLQVGPFKGLDLKTAPTHLDPQRATIMSNFTVNRQPGIAGYTGSLAVSAGRGPLIRDFTSYGIVTSIYKTKSGTNGTNPLWLFAIWNGGTTTIYQWDLITSNPGSIGASFPFYTAVTFTELSGWLFINPVINYSENAPGTLIQPWMTSANSPGIYAMTTWGIITPTVAPNDAAGAAGVLNGTYQYAYTFVNIWGESSPSPIGNAVTVTNKQVALSNIIACPDPNATVTSRNIYRIGGSLNTWAQVGTIFDNVTTTFTDNTADTAVTGGTLIFHQDNAPSWGFQAVETHKNRVWGFGPQVNNSQPFGQSPPGRYSDLWYSNYGDYRFDNQNQVFSAEADSRDFIRQPWMGDNAVGLASIGSVLICFKNKTTWGLFGDTSEDFVLRKLFDIGCISQWSIVKGDGIVFWLSREGVYSFDGNSLSYLSQPIDPALNTTATWNAAQGFYADRIYYLTVGNTTYGYDTISKEWISVPYVTYVYGGGTPGKLFTQDLAPYGGSPHFEIYGFTNNQLYQWLAAANDAGSAITAIWQSKLEDSGSESTQKRYRYVTLELGAMPLVGTSLTITVTVNPEQGPTLSFARTIDPSTLTSPQVQMSLPANFVGTCVQVNLAYVGTSTNQNPPLEIKRVAVYGWETRSMAKLL